MITYPTSRLLGVIDDPAGARGRGPRRGWRAGGADAVDLLVGEDGPATGLGTLGSRAGPLSRTIRVFQFMSMDQLPDFLVYERALVDGRAVVAVHVPNGNGWRPPPAC